MIKGMSDEWIVRVEGREYGPANIETLREWKAEGRLLPVNEARRADVDLWTTAAEIPGLFNVPPAVPFAGAVTQPPVQLSRRSFAEILTETLQIYQKGFFQFLGLTLLVLLPSICSQLTTAFVQLPQGSNVHIFSVLAAGFAFLMFILSIVMWPVYIAGIQILTAEIVRGNRFSLVAVLNEAVRFWPRVATLCIFVYGVFFLLMVFGLAIAAMALAGSVLSVAGPCRDGFARPAGLDVRPFLRERSVLAAVCRSRKRGIHRFIARKSRSGAQRTRSSVVSTAIVAGCIHRLDLVRRCVGDHTRCAVGDAAPVFQSIDDDSGPAGACCNK